ncbi:DUF6069 family protein [Actinophytocola sp.]|jgi:hypothetical protein|uniref:DUF6069 family protein n=1 Tax=Actinophytocola sp. TaxID=1872138 RepID=UPI002EDA20BD
MSDDVSSVRSDLDPPRLWAGGVATAAVAALAAVAGVLIARGIFGVAILAPEGDGIWGNANTGTYAALAAGAALLATGLRQLLNVATPAPARFFSWIMAMCTVIAVVLPLTLGADLGSRIATAAINLALGVIIIVLLNTAAESARKVRERARQEPAPGPDETWAPREQPW